VGSVVANLMFSLPAAALSTKVRGEPGLWLGEVIATFGLLLVIFGVVRSGRVAAAPVAVGAYIASAYWFTSSTSFANPAVTIARTITNTFAGIAPASAPPFLVAQILGALLAAAAIRFLYPRITEVAEEVVIPREARP
jgi:glycerol uptake facilitator-like aquaporin